MDKKAAFLDALESYFDFKGQPKATPDLLEFCRMVLALNDVVPFEARHYVSYAIGDAAKSDQWLVDGATYAGAANRIMAHLTKAA